MSKKRKKIMQPVHINSANVKQLQVLRGVGPILASAIFAERQRSGEFEDLADLTGRVAGLGPSVVEKMADFVRFDVPQTALVVANQTTQPSTALGEGAEHTPDDEAKRTTNTARAKVWPGYKPRGDACRVGVDRRTNSSDPGNSLPPQK